MTAIILFLLFVFVVMPAFQGELWAIIACVLILILGIVAIFTPDEKEAKDSSSVNTYGSGTKKQRPPVKLLYDTTPNAYDLIPPFKPHPEHNESTNPGYYLYSYYVLNGGRRKSYKSYSINGLYFHYQIGDEGLYNGYAKAETTNPYDPYAVGIYNKQGRLLGYIPKGNSFVWKVINERGGRVHAIYEIQLNYEWGFTSSVAIQMEPLSEISKYYQSRD